MEVEKTIELGDGHKIEFGKATWNKSAVSIRNRYPTSTGGFSPRSSSEIPIDDVKIILLESVKNKYITGNELMEIAELCINNFKDELSLSKTNKFKLIGNAALDPLFLEDISEIAKDFNFVDDENL